MAALETNESSTLTSLPPELLHRIFDVLTFDDVAAARLTCSLLATVGSEHLTSTARLVYSRDSFEMLDRVANHPLMSKKIKSLTYRAAMAGNHKTMHEYVVKITHLAGPGQVTTSRDVQRMQREYECLLMDFGIDAQKDFEVRHSLYEQQTEIAKSDIEMRGLTTLFKNCPSLEAVTLRIENGRSHPYIQDPHDRSGYSSLVRAGVDQLNTTCLAAKAARSTIRRLTAYDMDYQFCNLDTATLNLWQEILQDLYEFRLSFGVCGEGCIPEDCRAYPDIDVYGIAAHHFREKRVVHALLQSMPQLRVLRLSFPESELVDAEDTTIINFHDIVGSLTWPDLRDVSFQSISTTEDELVDFLLRHSRNLERMSLYYINLIKGIWESAFARIAGRFPKLRKIALGGEFKTVDLTYPSELWTEVDFGIPNDLRRSVHPVRCAFEAYVREGGDYPDVEALFEEESRLEAEDSINRGNDWPPWDVEVDIGYDSEASA